MSTAADPPVTVTVRFSSSDTGAILPANSTWQWRGGLGAGSGEIFTEKMGNRGRDLALRGLDVFANS